MKIEVVFFLVIWKQRIEREMQQKLEENEENTEEIHKTFTSLQQEVDIKTKKLKKVKKSSSVEVSKLSCRRPLHITAAVLWIKYMCIVVSYKVGISVTQWRSRRFNSRHCSAKYVGLHLNCETYSLTAPCNGLQGAEELGGRTRNSGVEPLLFSIKCTGFF